MANERKIVVENVRRVLLKEFIMKEVQRAGFGGLDIQRTPMGTRVTLIAERPGIVIGRKGASIKALTSAVDTQFSFENPQIEVQEVDEPALNAQIMAEKLASALERGWHFRRAGHSTVRRIMHAGAKGCLVTVSGKLTGQRHRLQKFKAGHVKYCGQPSYDFMQRGFAVAKLKRGVIGVTVEIMDPRAKLPDEVEILTPEQAGVELPPEPESLYVTPEVPPAAPEAPAEASEEVEVVAPVVEKKVTLKKSKLAEKRLKKVIKAAKELVDEVDVDIDVEAEASEEGDVPPEEAQEEAAEEPAEEPAAEEGPEEGA
jgi:small subunit ribosomal protein S3